MGVGQIAVHKNLINNYKSYLSGREQLVSIADTRSEIRTVLCGVPQWSILDPLIFLIHVNDVCNHFIPNSIKKIFSNNVNYIMCSNFFNEIYHSLYEYFIKII